MIARDGGSFGGERSCRLSTRAEIYAKPLCVSGLPQRGGNFGISHAYKHRTMNKRRLHYVSAPNSSPADRDSLTSDGFTSMTFPSTAAETRSRDRSALNPALSFSTIRSIASSLLSGSWCAKATCFALACRASLTTNSPELWPHPDLEGYSAAVYCASYRAFDEIGVPLI